MVKALVRAADASGVPHVVTDEERRRRTPLHAAASAGHAPVIEYLRSAGVVVDAKSYEDDDETPLQLACMGGHVEAVKALLSVGR